MFARSILPVEIQWSVYASYLAHAVVAAVHYLMNATTAILTFLAGVMQVVLPLMFCLALFLWWRRLRHWSFAVLSAATGLGFLAQCASCLAVNLIRKSANTDVKYLIQAGLTLNILMIWLLFTGAIGLFYAVKDDFMFEEAKRS